MKAVTICQPYAHLIVVSKEKMVENRTWSTRYRGPLLIHAGKSREWLWDGDEELHAAQGKPLEFGAIVGAATLATCVTIEDIEAGKLDVRFPKLKGHQHASGPWCWVLVNRVAFAEPIPYRGAQGLFNVPDEIVAGQIAAIKTSRAAP